MTQAATTMPTPIVTEMAATPQFTEGRLTVLHLLAVHEGVVLESASIAEYGGVWFKDIFSLLLPLCLYWAHRLVASDLLTSYSPSNTIMFCSKYLTVP
jgi:uncharacterized membrane protein